MTPKEKANELIVKYSPTLPFYNQKDNLLKSKQCALIAVDELINQEEKYNNGSFYPSKYWKEVKQEIKLL